MAWSGLPSGEFHQGSMTKDVHDGDNKTIDLEHVGQNLNGRRNAHRTEEGGETRAGTKSVEIDCSFKLTNLPIVSQGKHLVDTLSLKRIKKRKKKLDVTCPGRKLRGVARLGGTRLRFKRGAHEGVLLK